MTTTETKNIISGMEEFVIDATDKKIGRVASMAAALLTGKNKTSFAKNTVAKTRVVITNCAKADVTEKKRKSTLYTRYSGYPGGFKITDMEKVSAKKGMREIFRKAVYGMLPINKLRAVRIKNLVVKE